METKQEHIARVVDRIEVSERDLRGRIIAIEGQERRMEGIPAQVNKNEKDNAVQGGRQARLRDIRCEAGAARLLFRRKA